MVLCCLGATYQVQAQLPESIDMELRSTADGTGVELWAKSNGVPYSGALNQFGYTLKWPSSSTAEIGAQFTPCPGATTWDDFVIGTNAGYDYTIFITTSPNNMSSQCPSAVWAADQWVLVHRVTMTGNTGCTPFEIANDQYAFDQNAVMYGLLTGVDYCDGQWGCPNTFNINPAPVYVGDPNGACAEDCLGQPGGTTLPGSPCDDGNPLTTNDAYDANCDCLGQDCNGTVGGTVLPGASCDDGDACTTGDTIDANCDCVGTFADADGDGTCDAEDLCAGPEPGSDCDDGDPDTENDQINSSCDCVGTPVGEPDCLGVIGGPAIAGTPCDDLNDCTVNDLWDVNCDCVGTFQDTDEDGTCDADDLCPGGLEPGTACDDLDPCTTGDVIGANCLCAGTFEDSDGDGTCDADDVCANGPEPGTPCDDGDATTEDDVVTANCECEGTPITVFDCPDLQANIGDDCDDSDPNTEDDTVNANCECVGTPVEVFDCPQFEANIGDPCDDGNSETFGDAYNTNCECVGVPAGSAVLTMEVQTDANGNQTTWEIMEQGTETVVCSGGPYASSAVVTQNCTVPNGCYMLKVYDSAGDGMASGNNGGYILRMAGPDGARIIDNRRNFLSGSESAIANDQGFCLPLSDDRLIYTSCDKLDWLSNEFIVASLDPDVSAEWINGAPNSAQDNNSGYEFWFFDPNGTYSFRWFRGHNTSHGYGTGPARAAHLRINNWLAAYHIPEGVLMNVRVRGRVNGVNHEWGPACRFKIDPVAAQCPVTKLMDIPGNQFLSCGEYREFAPNSYVHARPVSGATQYQFRFRQPAEGFEVIRTNTSYFVQLWWAAPTPVLVEGSQYEVDVRAFKNGQWCPWGDVCTLNIGTDPGAQAGAGQSMMSQVNSAEISMWPNPNRGDQLYLSLSTVPEGVLTVNVDIFDMFGKRVVARNLAVQDGFINTVISLQGEIAAGMYMVNITAGEKLYTQRLVIQN